MVGFFMGVLLQLVVDGSETEIDEGDSWVDGEEDGEGKDAEHEGHHYRDLLLPGGFHELTLGEVPNVLGMGAEHIGQRRPTLHGNGDAVHEAGQRNQTGEVRELLQRFHQRLARTRLGQDQPELTGELAAG